MIVTVVPPAPGPVVGRRGDRRHRLDDPSTKCAFRYRTRRRRTSPSPSRRTKSPVAVGVPDSVPFEASVKPPGSAPEVTAKV